MWGKQIAAKIVKMCIYVTKSDANACGVCRLFGNSGADVPVRNLSQFKRGQYCETLALLVLKSFG